MEVDAVRGSGHPITNLTAAVQSPDRIAEQREVIQAVRAVNGAELFGQNNELSFVLDRETRRPIVRLVDRKTHETIRQIPPEHVLRMAEQLRANEDPPRSL